MVSFFTGGSWEKDTMFGAARKFFGRSYFVMALVSTIGDSFLTHKWWRYLWTTPKYYVENIIINNPVKKPNWQIGEVKKSVRSLQK